MIRIGSSLFKAEDYIRKAGYEERYDQLLKENEHLFTFDLIKEKLALAFSRSDECLVSEDIISIMEMCYAIGNAHLFWFERLLGNHFEGIIVHVTYNISAAKIEGINNKIKPKFTGIFSNYFLPLMPMESCRTEPMIPSVV